MCGCGGADFARIAADTALGNSAPAPVEPSAGFALEVLPESFIGGARATFALAVAGASVPEEGTAPPQSAALPDGGASPPLREDDSRTGALRVDIHTDNAAGLRALYCKVRYDATRWQPLAAEPAAAFGAPDQRISLAVLDEPGVVHFGALLIHPLEQAGFSGEGVLATITFKARRPLHLGPSSGGLSAAGPGARDGAATEAQGAPAPLRAPSAAPSEPFPLIWWSADEIKWPYVLRGDTDQNGEVGLSDLTPIGMHYGEAVPTLDDPSFVWINPLAGIGRSRAADADGDGEVSIADLTPIGAAFGWKAAPTFEVYGSLSPADYPADAISPNGPGASLLATVSLSDWEDQQPLDIHLQAEKSWRYYLTEVDPLEGQAVFWVRSGKGGAGAPAQSVRLDPIDYRPCADAWTAAGLLFDPGYPPRLEWCYWNSGDCNQDGLVFFDDVPWYGQFIGLGYPDYYSAPFMSDVDLNDEINLSDMYPIGAHVGWQVAGYRVYASNNSADYPDPSAPGVQLVAEITFESALGDPLTDRLRFQYDLLPWPGEMPKQFVWVSPYSWGSEAADGAASVLLDLGVPALSFSLSTPSEWYDGSGTTEDPFVVDPVYPNSLSIIGPLDVNVSTSQDTVYNATIALEFLPDPISNMFRIPDAFTGDFSISATYKGEPTVPPALYFRVAPAS